MEGSNTNAYAARGDSRSLFYFHSDLGTKRTRLRFLRFFLGRLFFSETRIEFITKRIPEGEVMNFKSSIMVIFLVTIIGKCSSNAVLTLIHDLVQNNIAGVPTVHQHTEWDFDPKEGKVRRARYESLNGRYGQELIDRLGMGMGFKGPWGSKVSSQEKPAVRYV